MNSARAGRVLVAVPDPQWPDELLELGMALASRREGQLLALVREASEFAAVGALPFAGEVDRWSGALRPFDSAAAARAMARTLDACARRLSGLAAERRVQAAMEVIRGHLASAALAALAAPDVLLLGGPARPGYAKPARPSRRRIGVAADDPLALALAREIAEAAGGGEASLVRLSDGELLDLAAGADIGVLVVPRAGAEPATLQRYLCIPGRCVVIAGD